jgi:hypothetical protein
MHVLRIILKINSHYFPVQTAVGRDNAHGYMFFVRQQLKFYKILYNLDERRQYKLVRQTLYPESGGSTFLQYVPNHLYTNDAQ